MMLLAMGTVLAVVWCFASHGIAIGLIFSMFAYVIVRTVYLGNRWLAISATVLCLICWIGLQLFGPYTSLVNRVRWQIGVGRLQTWTISVLNADNPTVKEGEIEEIPEDIRRVLPTAHLVSDAFGTPKCIQFVLNADHPTHGLLVGRPGFVRPASKYHTEEIADGIWAYRPDHAPW